MAEQLRRDLMQKLTELFHREIPAYGGDADRLRIKTALDRERKGEALSEDDRRLISAYNALREQTGLPLVE